MSGIPMSETVTRTISSTSFERIVGELLSTKSALEAYFNSEDIDIDLDTDEGINRAKTEFPDEYEQYSEIKQALIELQA